MPHKRHLTLLFVLLLCATATFSSAAQPTLPLPVPNRGLVQRGAFEVPAHLLPQTRAPLAITVTRFDDPVVGSCNTADGVSLREAIVNCSVSNQPVIYLPAGTYTLTSSISTTGGRSFTLIGQDPLTTIIQGSAGFRNFDIGLTGLDVVSFANLTLQGSTSGASGNALRFVGNGTAHLDNMRIRDNSNSVRGTLRIDVEEDSTLRATISNSEFTGNSASAGAGLGFTNELGGGSGFLTISDSLISGNTASGSGSGILIQSLAGYTDAQIINTTVEDNAATSFGQGGGLHISGGSASSLTVTGSTFQDNRSAIGAGMIVNVTGGIVSIHDTQFLGNGHPTQGSGGGIFFNAASMVSITGSQFDGNSAPDAGGGGIYMATNVGTVDIRDTVVSNNTADTGGGIYALDVDSFTTDGLIVTGNSAAVEGGGMLLAASNFVSLSNTQITRNTAGTELGGLWTARAVLLNVLIEDNSAPFMPDCRFDGLGPGSSFSLGGVAISDMTDCTGPFTPAAGDLLGNLLINGGFEFAGVNTASPLGWTLKNITNDKRACNKVGKKPVTPYGSCAMQFSGGLGENAILTQNADLTGLVFSPGNELRLYAMGDGSQTTSKLKITLKASYTDQPTNKTSITFTGNPSALLAQSQILTLLSGNVSKLNVQIKHTSPTGKFILDRVYLTR